MGVPAFYRWLSEKYPKIVSDVLEERPFVLDGHPICLPDARQPNPSEVECDNFYIDLNGVIHPCSHPEHGPQPKNEFEMYVRCLCVELFLYIFFNFWILWIHNLFLVLTMFFFVRFLYML